MPKLKQHRSVDETYFAEASKTVTVSQDIPASATALFESLAGPEDWKRWLGLDVDYTSDPATGVGTTRTISKGPIVIEEYFFVWEPGNRLAFRADRSSLPVAAFAEDYLITSTGKTSCRLDWTTALDGKPGLFGAPVAFAMKRNAQKGVAKLAEMMAERAS